MNVFLSYANEDRAIAEDIYHTLLGSGHRVFFDRKTLASGQEFNLKIRKAIFRSKIFIFLISPASIENGTYTLTELQYAMTKWPHPKGGVLPVQIRATDNKQIPSYLRAITILKPEGNVAAEITAHIDDTFRSWVDRVGLSPILVAILIVATAVIGIASYSYLNRDQSAEPNAASPTVQTPRGASEHVKRAAATLDSPEWKPRRQAINTLSESPAPAAVLVLKRALSHPLVDVRAQAALALSERMDTEAVPVMIELLDHEDWGGDALNSLAKVGPDMIPKLTAVLNRKDESFIRRHLAAIALIRSSVPEAVQTGRTWTRAAIEDTKLSDFRNGVGIGLRYISDAEFAQIVKACLVNLTVLNRETTLIGGLERLQEWETKDYLPKLQRATQALSINLVPVPVLINHPDGPDIELSPLISRKIALSDQEVTDFFGRGDSDLKRGNQRFTNCSYERE